MHYVKDSKGNWFYDDNGVWYYDFTAVAGGTDPELVEEMKKNMEKEDYNVEHDVDMEDDEETSNDDEDLDYDLENDDYPVDSQSHSSESLSEVLLGLRTLRSTCLKSLMLKAYSSKKLTKGLMLKT